MLMSLIAIMFFFQYMTSGTCCSRYVLDRSDPAEQLHRDHGMGMRLRHRRRAHRPVGRLGASASSARWRRWPWWRCMFHYALAALLCIATGAVMARRKATSSLFQDPFVIVTLAGVLVLQGPESRAIQERLIGGALFPRTFQLLSSASSRIGSKATCVRRRC